MRRKMNMINIVPAFTKAPDFTISEIRRQAADAKLGKFALSFSFHPEGTPARNKIAHLCNHFRTVAEGLRDTKIELGILIQSTQGHGWNGKVPLTRETWQQIVNYDGTVSPRMCPSDPDFRAYVREAVSECVRAGAAFLLVDDDFGLRVNECFCPRHIAMYNAALGKNYTIEEIRKIIDERSWQDPEVMTISQVRLETALDFAKDIRSAIDSVNPDIRCGLCTPWAGHTFVGPSAKILAGRTEPFIRINNAIYGMQNPLNFIELTQQTLRVKYQAPEVKDFIDEADTFPQNYYSESAAAFHSHICNAVLNGLSGCKLWTSEFNNPADSGSQRRYESYLSEYHGFYEELLNTVDGIRWQGTSGLLFHAGYGLHPIRCGGALSTRDWCVSMLGPYAFPIRYAETGNGGIYTLCGGDAAHFSDDQIRTLLAGRVLIDSEAAKKLTARGFAPLMGVEASDGPDDFAFSREIHAGSRLGVGFMWEPSAAALKPLSDKVKVVTELCAGLAFTADYTPVAPGMTFFRNELGGRVAVTALSVTMPFYKTMRPPRRIFLREALDFLAGGTLEMSVENADQQVFVRHGILKDGAELLALHNLALDPLPCIDVRLKRDPRTVEQLDPAGTWSAVPFRRTDAETVRLDCDLNCCLPRVFRFRF